MHPIAKLLIISGVVLIVAGLVWHFVGRTGIPLGKLPGDVAVEKENFKFYFPITTSILISVLLTLILWAVSYFRK